MEYEIDIESIMDELADVIPAALEGLAVDLEKWHGEMKMVRADSLEKDFRARIDKALMGFISRETDLQIARKHSDLLQRHHEEAEDSRGCNDYHEKVDRGLNR